MLFSIAWISNTKTGKAVEISYVEDRAGKPIYYLFYVRPKEVKRLFGLSSKMKPGFVSDRLDCSTEDCLRLLNLFARDDYAGLEKLFQ